MQSFMRQTLSVSHFPSQSFDSYYLDGAISSRAHILRVFIVMDQYSVDALLFLSFDQIASAVLLGDSPSVRSSLHTTIASNALPPMEHNSDH